MVVPNALIVIVPLVIKQNVSATVALDEDREAIENREEPAR